MKACDIAAIAFSVLGIFWMIYGITGLLALLVNPINLGFWDNCRMIIVSLSYPIVAFLVIRYARVLAEKVTKNLTEVPDAIVIHGASMVRTQAMAFSVAAVVIGIDGMNNLVLWTASVLMTTEDKQSLYRSLPTFAYSIFQIGIAFWLFFGSRSLAVFWSRLGKHKSKKIVIPSDLSTPLS